ncbi:MAG: hypothetical protein ACLPQS_03780 [Acidimicrobiales bacterium]
MAGYDDVAESYDVTSGEQAGFLASIESFQSRTWITSAGEQSQSISDRVWPALRGLDDETFEAVAQPALGALSRLPDGPIERQAAVDMVVLSAP